MILNGIVTVVQCVGGLGLRGGVLVDVFHQTRLRCHCGLMRSLPFLEVQHGIRSFCRLFVIVSLASCRFGLDGRPMPIGVYLRDFLDVMFSPFGGL